MDLSSGIEATSVADDWDDGGGGGFVDEDESPRAKEEDGRRLVREEEDGYRGMSCSAREGVEDAISL